MKWHLSPVYGSMWWTDDAGGPLWVLKAPWCRALFSEREGIQQPVWKFMGWRLLRGQYS